MKKEEILIRLRRNIIQILLSVSVYVFTIVEYDYVIENIKKVTSALPYHVLIPIYLIFAVIVYFVLKVFYKYAKNNSLSRFERVRDKVFHGFLFMSMGALLAWCAIIMSGLSFGFLR